MTVNWTYRTDIDDDQRKGPPEAFVRFVWAISKTAFTTALTQDEEYDLIVAAKRGDNVAVRRLMASHERFLVTMAVKVARQNSMRHMIKDLQQTAYTEFLAAIEPFSLDNEARFATYARYRVAGALLRQALDFRHAMAIGKSSDERKAYYNMRAAIDGFVEANGRKPDESKTDIGDLAGRLGVSPRAFKRGADAKTLSTLPLHHVEIWDQSTEDCPNIDREKVRALMEEATSQVMAALGARDRTILSDFLEDPDDFDGAALAQRFGITSERVGQVRRAALSKIRDLLTASGLAFADLVP